MFRLLKSFLLLALVSCATTKPQTAESKPDLASDLMWLDSLDDRYVSFNKPLVLASWQQKVGETPVDTGDAEKAQASFYADQSMRGRLKELAAQPGSDISRRARSWLVFLDRDRLESDPKVIAINERIEKMMNGNEGAEPAMVLIKNLVFDAKPKVQASALAEIVNRSRAVMPLFLERAQRLDEVAREVGAESVATFVSGSNASDDLEATCRAQTNRTAEDWKVLLSTLQRRLGRPAELADYAGAAVAWTTEAGAFFTPERLGPLAEAALTKMGFDIKSMNIIVRINPNTVGGSAYDVSIPDDVRFQGNFTSAGFDSARGYFHELGHAIHMKMVRAKHLPERQLPQDRALNEGIGEIFGLIPRDPTWINETFPDLTERQRDEFHRSVRGFDALAVRYNCLQARLEQEIYARRDLAKRWPVIFQETFGAKPTIGPTWLLFHPSYMKTPFYMRGYVYLNEVRDTFVRRLNRRPLLSREAGTLLTETLLAPGNSLTLDSYLREPAVSR
jgi:hypothetical protein